MFSSSNNLKFAFLSELQKTTQEEKLSAKKEQNQVLHSWFEFERRILASPNLRTKFASLQNEFLSSPEKQKNYPAEFISGVLSLHLEESESQ